VRLRHLRLGPRLPAQPGDRRHPLSSLLPLTWLSLTAGEFTPIFLSFVQDLSNKILLNAVRGRRRPQQSFLGAHARACMPVKLIFLFSSQRSRR
jgi:hypothetical protein